MNIRQGDLVLEVGSGNNPSPRSDILLDRYLFDNGQRAGEFRIVVDRPLVVGDGYHLPFKNKTFDYVICSHILEHMEDPKAFMREMTRVGKAGYIEVPSDVSERIFGWNFHLWYCRLHGKTLVLTKKREGERFGGFFHRLIANQMWFRRFFEEHEDAMYTRLEWKGSVHIRVVSKELTASALASLDRRAYALLSKASLVVWRDGIFAFGFFLRRARRKTRKVLQKTLWILQTLLRKESLMHMVVSCSACPSCRGALRRRGSTIQCTLCKATYPMVGVIPILLTRKERKKGY